MRKTKVLMAAYAAAAATDLMAITRGMDEVRLISKSVLMPLLILYAFTRFAEKKSGLFIMLIISLVFSWLGDLFLLFDTGESSFFIFGLLSFLLAHIAYIFIYRKAKYPNTELALLPTQQMRYLFILVLAGSAVIYVLFPHLGDLALPVIVYAGALTYMAIAALYRYGRTTGSSFALVFIGAMLFMLSDSMLAVNKFVGAFSYAGFWVMATYAGAQLLIVEGLAVHADVKKP